MTLRTRELLGCIKVYGFLMLLAGFLAKVATESWIVAIMTVIVTAMYIVIIELKEAQKRNNQTHKCKPL